MEKAAAVGTSDISAQIQINATKDSAGVFAELRSQITRQFATDGTGSSSRKAGVIGAGSRLRRTGTFGPRLPGADHADHELAAFGPRDTGGDIVLAKDSGWA